MNGNFLTVNEWAHKNKLSISTVREWCENGTIEGVERFGSEWAIPANAKIPSPHYGKEQCMLLKKVRKNIAELNGIEYEPNICPHNGNCPGTCPACDEELAFLEKELKNKKERGERILVDNIGIREIKEFNNRIINETERFRDLNKEFEEELPHMGRPSFSRIKR